MYTHTLAVRGTGIKSKDFPSTMKRKTDRQRKYSRTRETNGTCKVKAMHDSELSPFTLKDIIRTFGEMSMASED